MKIAIVGYGAAGGASALLLARQGHDVTLFEQAPELKPVGAGVLLQPSGQLALAKMGLLESVIADAEPIERLLGYTQKRKVLDDLPYGEIFTGCQAYGLHRGDLFKVLHAAVVASGVRVCLNSRIHKTHTDAKQVILLDANDRDLGSFDFLLACDGLRSTLREQSNISTRGFEYQNGALWALGQCSAVRRALHQDTVGSRVLCGLLPMGQGRCSLFWSLHKKDLSTWKDQPLEQWKKRVLAVSPKAEELLAGIHSHEDVRFTTYRHVVMSSWFRDRTLFLGDAGHALSPHTGQGINLALIDAWVFAHCLKQTGEFSAACIAYTQRRRAHVRFYRWVTWALAPFFQSESTILGWGRDMALPIMHRLPLIRRQMLITMAGLKAGFLSGPLANDYFE